METRLSARRRLESSELPMTSWWRRSQRLGLRLEKRKERRSFSPHLPLSLFASSFVVVPPITAKRLLDYFLSPGERWNQIGLFHYLVPSMFFCICRDRQTDNKGPFPSGRSSKPLLSHPTNHRPALRIMAISQTTLFLGLPRRLSDLRKYPTLVGS